MFSKHRHRKRLRGIDSGNSTAVLLYRVLQSCVFTVEKSAHMSLGLRRVGDIAVKLKRLKISTIIFLECSYPGACFSPVLGIIAVMTLLAQSTKILWVTILWLMVEVCHRQNDISKFPCLLIQTVRVILYTTELTVVFCSLQYGCSYLFPVGRITAFILWSYWHFLIIY